MRADKLRAIERRTSAHKPRVHVLFTIEHDDHTEVSGCIPEDAHEHDTCLRILWDFTDTNEAQTYDISSSQ